MAEIYTAMYCHSFGIDIKISGFNDSLKRWMQEIIEKLIAFDPTQDEKKFQTIHNQLKMGYKNFNMGQPYLISNHHLSFALRSCGVFDNEECLKTITQMTFKDFGDLAKEWLKYVRFEWLTMGNLEAAPMMELINFTEEKLKKKGCLMMEKENSTQVRIGKLKKNSHFFYDYMIPEIKQTNSDVCMLFQDERHPKSKILCMLLENYLNVPFFSELRTKQQIGYIVDVYHEDFRGIQTINFAIQSERFPSHNIALKILEFLDSIKEKLLKIDEEEFLTYKKSVLNRITVKDLNLFKEVERHWFEVASHQYMFERKEKETEILNNLNKEEFIEFCKRLFWEKPRILEIHSVCRNHNEENKKLKEERMRNCENLKEITNLKGFISTLSLYPDFFSYFQEKII